VNHLAPTPVGWVYPRVQPNQIEWCQRLVEGLGGGRWVTPGEGEMALLSDSHHLCGAVGFGPGWRCCQLQSWGGRQASACLGSPLYQRPDLWDGPVVLLKRPLVAMRQDHSGRWASATREGSSSSAAAGEKRCFGLLWVVFMVDACGRRYHYRCLINVLGKMNGR